MKIKKIACLILSLAIIATICGCAKKGVVIMPAAYDSTTQYDFSLKGEPVTVGDYTLSFDDSLGFPIVSKDGTDKVWDSSVEALFASSAIFIDVYDAEFESFQTVKSIDAVGEGRVKAEPITNGVRVTYFFDEFEVSVPVYYTISENGLKIKVIPSEIDEHKYNVISVAVSPYLCSALNEKNNDRYLVLPSGSGALMYTDNRGEARTYMEEVYGADLATEEKWQYTNSQQVHLPVFGAVDGDNAMYGVITSGAESSSIGAHAGDLILGYSGVYPIFNIRSYNTVQVNIGGTTGLKEFVRLADKRNAEVFEVQYSVLSGEDASYNGIAAAYREHLGLKSGVANKHINLTLLGGVMADRSALGVPYTDFSTTTTLAQAKDMVSEIYEANKTAMNVRLLGFGNTGLTVDELAGGFKINSSLGSASQVKQLQDFCKSISSDLFMDFDVLQFVNSGNGYSTRDDVTVDTTDYRVKKYSFDIALRNVDKTQESKYLLSRNNISSAVDKTINTIKNYGIGGVSLDTLGRFAYSDFSENQYFGKAKMDDDVAQVLSNVSKSNLKILTKSSNAYAAKASDYIDSIPTVSSNLKALDVDIPFYGIVFSGCKENSVAINLSSEPRKKFLNAIKTGSGLSFVLAKDINSDVVGSVFSAYIASNYEYGKEEIKKYYDESKDFLSSVSGVSVDTYTIIQTGVTKTVFENGVTVYVNETRQTVTCEDVVVEPLSFKVR